jgi:hypothetical protein
MSQFFQGTTAGSLPPSVPLQFTTDAGIAIPASNNINVVTPGSGTEGITTSASGSTITVTLTDVATQYVNVTSAMSPYTVTATDYFISVDATGGPITINLPDAPSDLREFVVKDRTGKCSINNITVKSLTNAATIDGQTTYVFVDNFESLECIYHNSNYEIY